MGVIISQVRDHLDPGDGLEHPQQRRLGHGQVCQTHQGPVHDRVKVKVELRPKIFKLFKPFS